MKYRAEIDGLRALAVIPVILFHAGFELFSGGFVGVDVFFVISGYLITTILIEDIENKRFSIVNFYERRARRILPALFFVMLVCIPFAWMWMLPNQLKDFSQSLVAVSLFASNILFWRESGYFDAAAEEKPLLHTWSLAVEEQYYVLFPIFLILAWRFGKNRVFWMIVGMAAISLLLSEWGWRNKATANFYLAPTRAWELFAGSIAAFVVKKHGVQKHNLLALAGLAAIIFSIFFYDEATPFPSVYTLVPVVGVVLLVLYADEETFAAKLLSIKGCVGIGLISYSAYLWHQPLFAFFRLRTYYEPDINQKLALVVVAFLLAAISWKFIESPFRNRTVKISWLLAPAVIIMGFALLIMQRAESFYTNEQLEYLEEARARTPNRNDCLSPYSGNRQPCIFGDINSPPKIAVLGDSHAITLAYTLGLELEEQTSSLTFFGYTHCPPLLGVSPIAYKNDCSSYYESSFAEIAAQDSIKAVIMLARWPIYYHGTYFHNPGIGTETGVDPTVGLSDEAIERTQGFMDSLGQSISLLQEAGKTVYFITTIPEVGVDVVNFYWKQRFLYGNSKRLLTPRDLVEERDLFLDDFLASRTSSQLMIFEAKDVFCGNMFCNTDAGYQPIYYDENHLNLTGMRILVENLLQKFPEISANSLQ